MNRRAFLAGLLSAPVVSMLPDVRRPGFLELLHVGVDLARAGADYTAFAITDETRRFLLDYDSQSPVERQMLRRTSRAFQRWSSALGRPGRG